ncbi:hypothetical protein BJ742DRAFT_832402 [Cladochytrium replicatum]|nr:hypothetical protein BJ742DRAFT_832402 [Cladochytrium replicatum]
MILSNHTSFDANEFSLSDAGFADRPDQSKRLGAKPPHVITSQNNYTSSTSTTRMVPPPGYITYHQKKHHHHHHHHTHQKRRRWHSGRTLQDDQRPSSHPRSILLHLGQIVVNAIRLATPLAYAYVAAFIVSVVAWRTHRENILGKHEALQLVKPSVCGDLDVLSNGTFDLKIGLGGEVAERVGKIAEYFMSGAPVSAAVERAVAFGLVDEQHVGGKLSAEELARWVASYAVRAAETVLNTLFAIYDSVLAYDYGFALGLRPRASTLLKASTPDVSPFIVIPFVMFTVWMFLETFFYLHYVLTVQRMQQAPAGRPDTRFHYAKNQPERLKLFKECMDSVLAACDATKGETSEEKMYRHAVGRDFLSRWFHNAPFEALKAGNVCQWFAWAFFDRQYERMLRDYVSGYDDEFLDLLEIVEMMAVECGLEPTLTSSGALASLRNAPHTQPRTESLPLHLLGFPSGTNPSVACIRLNHDPVYTRHRPLFTYLLTHTLHFFTHVMLTRILKFEARTYTTCNNTVKHLVYARIPPGQEDREKNPVVFAHGIGIGLGHYLGLIFWLPRRAPVYLITLPHVAMRLGCETAPEVADFVELFQQILRPKKEDCWDEEGGKYVPATFVAHSLGTATVSWVVRNARTRGLVKSVVLLDPVTLLLHDPTVATSFLHRVPRTIVELFLEYFVARETYIANSLSRGFAWSYNVVFANELSAIVEKEKKLEVEKKVVNPTDGAKATSKNGKKKPKKKSSTSSLKDVPKSPSLARTETTRQTTESPHTGGTGKVTVVLCGGDCIVPSPKVRRYLRSEWGGLKYSGSHSASGLESAEDESGRANTTTATMTNGTSASSSVAGESDSVSFDDLEEYAKEIIDSEDGEGMIETDGLTGTRLRIKGGHVSVLRGKGTEGKVRKEVVYFEGLEHGEWMFVRPKELGVVARKVYETAGLEWEY